MRRLTITLLAAAIGLGIGGAVALARSGGRGAVALEASRGASEATYFQREAAPHRKVAGPAESADQEEDSTKKQVAAPCDPEVMLPIITEAIQIPYSGMYWDSVDIAECQNGYARAFAITGGAPPPGTQLEGGEQVFLQDVGGKWAMLSSGSGLDCYPSSMPTDLKDACDALGLT